MKVVYLGEGKAKELATMVAPHVVDFHDPAHFEMEKEIFIEHINALKTFDVAPELAALLIEGKVYDDETTFKVTTILIKK